MCGTSASSDKLILMQKIYFMKCIVVNIHILIIPESDPRPIWFQPKILFKQNLKKKEKVK